MKTTIDLPDTLYRDAKIRAIERSTSLKELIITALSREIATPLAPPAPVQSAWAKRKLPPEYQRLLAEGAFSGGTDSTQIISEERDDR